MANYECPQCCGPMNESDLAEGLCASCFDARERAQDAATEGSDAARFEYTRDR